MDTQKRIIVWFSAALVVTIAGVGAYQMATSDPVELPRKDGTLSLSVDQSDWTKGSKTPKMSLVEYSDFQCPACEMNYPWVEEVLKEYSDRISFTYRHFPLPPQKHKNALPAAYASEAAGKQGKFWEMADMLFKNQAAWAGSSTAATIFEGYAEKLGLNMMQYKSDVKSDEVKSKVARDKKSGEMSLVDHTPTFFINGKKSQNPSSVVELKALIEYAIAHPDRETK